MRTCIVLMRPPMSIEDSERLFGMAVEAVPDVTVFLLGDGVLCARKGLAEEIGSRIGPVLEKGGRVKASARDLRARGIDPRELFEGVSVENDIEGEFLSEAMEKSGRVFTW